MVEKIKRSPKVSLLLLFAFIFVVLGTYNIKPNNSSVAETGTATNCGIAYMYFEPPDIAVAHVYVDTTQPSLPKKIEIFRNGNIIGQAKPEGSAHDWFMKIPLRLLDPDPKPVFARIIFEDGHSCQTESQNDGIGSANYNTEPVNMDIIPSKQSIVLPTNNSTTISARIHLHPSIEPNGDFFTEYAIYDWSAHDRGNISSRFNRATSFFSGPYEGVGKVKVRVQLGNLQSELIIPTKVESSSSPIKDNSTSSSTATSTSTGTSNTVATEAEKEEIKQTSVLEGSDPKVSCAESAIGKTAFKDINEGKRRPTTQELEKLKNCFAESRYIIPSNFAPVSPSEVSRLQTSTKTKLSSVNSSTKKIDEVEKSVLLLSGTAEPNSTVVIYVFSEPLILTTTASSNGEWVYELEDPLEPGEHEVYAIVDRGDGVYEKSDPLNFVIANAEATAENPAGLSLTLNEQESSTESNINTILYSLASALLLLAIVAVAYLAYRKGKNSHIPKTVTVDSDNRDTPIDNGTINTQTVSPNQMQNNITDSPVAPTLVVGQSTKGPMDIQNNTITPSPQAESQTPLNTQAINERPPEINDEQKQI